MTKRASRKCALYLEEKLARLVRTMVGAAEQWGLWWSYVL